jgi:ribonucleoside-diphosphate reductase alpha chain
MDRYSRKSPEGVATESVNDTWQRVSQAIADNDTQADQFYGILKDFKFVPGGRILAGAGTDTEVTFFNCFVIPVRNRSSVSNGNDSREAIFDTISEMVNIMSRGGGVGINWSTLRPKGAYLSRINGTTSGPIEWMDVASQAVGAVMQGGSRRGAAMFMLHDWHPDVLTFINAKRDFKKITNANISVCISDKFMQAVKADADWELVFPDTTHPEYNKKWNGELDEWIEAGLPVKTHNTEKARYIWEQLAYGAWDNGEPGVIFLERYNKLSTAASIEKIISVNPCGEQGLGAYSVCNLGAMNLAAYCGPQGTGKPRDFDFSAFSRDVKLAVRFLDNVIDRNPYGEFENTRQQQLKLRRIGLSVMGLADALIKQKMRYGSPEAVAFTESVFRVMKASALTSSIEIAKEKGPAEAWDTSMIERPYLAGSSDSMKSDMEKYGLRNLFLLTQAPTGTTSIVAGVNSGIEPYFAFEYERNDRTGKHIVKAPVVEEYYANPIKTNLNPLPNYFVSANDLSVEDHIYMQAAAQKYIDSSVSKTLNAPNSHSVEEVVKAYTLAYDAGLKSIAYFRDGCGRSQVLTTVDTKSADNGNAKPHIPSAYKRPTILQGTTKRVPTDVGTAFITINYESGNRPREIFVNVGKGGTDLSEISEAVGRIISVALQKDIPASVIADQLFGVGGYSKVLKSLPSAIALALTEVTTQPESAVVIYANGNGADPAAVSILAGRSSEACPDCSSFSLNHVEGCMTCALCGFSAC